MTLDEFRNRMWAYRQAVERESNNQRSPNLAWDKLRDLYRRLDSAERGVADRVLCEWVLSDDENLRYDALVLISDFEVKSALPALSELASRLKASTSPGAPYELRKVESMLKVLSASAPTAPRVRL
jgi:hypothetical protein